VTPDRTEYTVPFGAEIPFGRLRAVRFHGHDERTGQEARPRIVSIQRRQVTFELVEPFKGRLDVTATINTTGGPQYRYTVL
jgi:hypothetical protein